MTSSDTPSSENSLAGERPCALTGLRVVSMAEQYPGPLCTMILSDMGADVIQVERPKIGDPSRFLKFFYERLNRGKRSVALDIRDDADKERLLALVVDADVFLEGFRPGKLAARGLGYEDLKAVNPRLIYCSISGYGQTGPYRDRPAHDITFQGIGGALDERLKGDVNGLPPATLMGDTASALYATIGLLSAIVARHRDGVGTHIDIAMSDSVLATQTPFAGGTSEDDPAPPQAEPAYGLFRCADGRFLTLSIAHEDDYWKRLCWDLNLTDLVETKRDERVSKREEIKDRVAAVIASRPFEAWEATFEKSGQMWGPAYRLDDVSEDPQIEDRDLFARLERADGVSQLVLRQPIRFSAYRNAPLRRAPRLNETPDAGFD